MRWVKIRIKEILLIFLLIKVSCCQMKIYSASPTHSTVQFYTHVKRLLELCFSDLLNPILITEELFDETHKIPWEIVDPSTIIVNKNFEPQDIQVFNPRYPTYLLSMADSINKLKALFDKLKSATTWSIESLFFIVEVENFCDNAYESLKLLSKMDLLSSFYLCREPGSDGLIIYSFNPFADYAPHPWKSAEKTGKDIAEKGTLYHRHFYTNDQKVCLNMVFDKTKILDNQEVKMTIAMSLPNMSLNDVVQEKNTSHRSKFGSKYSVSVNYLLNLMNVTPSRYFIHPQTASDAMKTGYLRILAEGNYDVNERRWLIENTNYKYSDVVTLYQEVKFSILTQKRDFFAITSQVGGRYSFEILAFTFIVLLLITIFLVIFNNFAIGESLLDVLSLMFNMGIMTPLRRLSIRILFLIATFYIFFASSTIQDEISALLVSPSRYNVDTLQDLFNHDYHVFYGWELHEDMLQQNIWVTDDDKKFLHPVNFGELIKCKKQLPSNSSIACIYITGQQLRLYKKFPNLYLSKDAVFTKHYGFWTRKNWSLKKKFDKIAQRTFEVGLTNHQESSFTNSLKNIKKQKKIEAYEELDEVTETNLTPTYKIFGSCLIIAIFVMIVELLINRLLY